MHTPTWLTPELAAPHVVPVCSPALPIQAGRVPSSPELPWRSLNLDSFKQLHIHATPSSSMLASRRSTCTNVSGLSCFQRTTTRPLSNILVISTGLYHGNCKLVPRFHPNLGRAGTLPAVRPGVRSQTRLPSPPSRPAPGVSRTWPEPGVMSARSSVIMLGVVPMLA